MSVRFWKQLAVLLRRLSPEAIRKEADRPFSLAVIAADGELRRWAGELAPAAASARKRDQALKRLFTVPVPISPAYAGMMPQFDLRLATPSGAGHLRALSRDYVLLPDLPEEDSRWARAVVDEVWEGRPDLGLAMARNYLPFREPAISRVISAVARENAGFALLSALPNLLPGPLSLPWAVGEFASDTTVITANQFRMAFMIAAASDAEVGWRAQKGQLASILGSAFGWRAVARELAGKLPAGVGLVPKALIAYAATHVVGQGLEHYHRIGRHLTRTEKRQAYQAAIDNGRRVVEDMARKMLPRGRSAGMAGASGEAAGQAGTPAP